MPVYDDNGVTKRSFILRTTPGKWGRYSWKHDKLDSTFFMERANPTYSSMDYEFETLGYIGTYTWPGSSEPVPMYTKNQETDKNGRNYDVYYINDNRGWYHPWRVCHRGQTSPINTYLTIVDKDAPSVPGQNITTNTGGGNSDYTVVDGTDYEPGIITPGGGYTMDVDDILSGVYAANTSNSSALIDAGKSVLGMFGIPYQFMPHVDPRLAPSSYSEHGSSIVSANGEKVSKWTASYMSGDYLHQYSGTGREWGKMIAANMPILFITPGKPNFMGSYNKEDSETVMNQLMNKAANLVTGDTSSLDLNTGKYYTFEATLPEAYTYINPACRIAAGYMGVGDETIDNKRLDMMNWMEYTAGKLRTMFGNLLDVTTYSAIPFYIESETQISESFSNETTDSQLAGWADSFSDIGREAMYLLGMGKEALGINALSFIDVNNLDAYNAMTSQLQDNNLVSNILNSLASVATGGRLIFPKIWSDSGFSRSYDVTIKLRSPDMDKKSLFLNIIVPYLHIWCCAMPKAADKNPNAMFAPFIIRAIYKGFFNIDMGIISSMSVTKGDQAQWTPDGIPSAIDVNITITDLYENLSITGTSSGKLAYDTMNNTNMMDYIATLCGVNIFAPEIIRDVQMWAMNNVVGRVTDFINLGVWGKLQNGVAETITKIYRP